MEQEVVGMQPWQVFTAMFVAFWAISAYFDHFLLTTVFCIAFGVFGEIMTKVMYGEKISRDLEIQKEELKNLLELVNNEDIRYEELNDKIEQDSLNTPSEEIETVTIDKEEIEEDEEDEPPPLPAKDYETPPLPAKDYEIPPLPAKDYETDNNVITDMSMENSLIDIDNIDVNVANIDDMNNAEEAVMSEDYHPDVIMNGNYENMTGNVAHIESEAVGISLDHPDETIENIQFEVADQSEFIDLDINVDPNTMTNQCESTANQNQNLSSNDPELLINDNELVDVEVNGKELTNENVQMGISEAVEDINVLEEIPADKCIIGLEEDKNIPSNNEVEMISSEIYPIEEDMHQVNISNDAHGEAENNTATTEFIINENSAGCDTLPLETFVNSEENQNIEETNREITQDFTEEVINQFEVEDEDTISVAVAVEETETSNNTSLQTSGQAVAAVSGNPEIDIDLTDPAVEAAATKIQSAFKGFKLRKNISKQ